MQVVTSYAALKRMGDAARAEYLAERRARGMSDTDIFREIGLSSDEMRRARWFLMARGQADSTATARMPNICCDCAVCDCEWILHGRPVEGWEAEPSGWYRDGYHVLKCPLYVKMVRGKL